MIAYPFTAITTVLDARRVVVGAIRAATTAKEDATDRPRTMDTGPFRPVDVHPLEGLVARGTDEPRVEATTGVVIEVTTGQVPTTTAGLGPTFRGLGQGSPRQDEAEGLVVPGPASLVLRETVRPTPT